MRSARIFAAAATAAAAAAAAATPFCGTCANGGAPPMDNTAFTVACPGGAVIASLPFVAYGTPKQAGSGCDGWARGSCDAAAAPSIVAAACLGKPSCTVFPNSTTFGDPCYGTVKQLAVVATCSGGAAGTASCAVLPPPTPSPPPNASVTVDVQWGAPSPAALFQTEPSMQVVSQHFLFASSPNASVYANSWAAAAALGARRVRFATWFPYAKVGVPELDPPTGSLLCGPRAWSTGGQSQPFTLSCPGSTVAAVDFASWGTPSGVCGSYAPDATCADPKSASIVTAACVGRASCTLSPSMFTTPGGCGSNAPYLAVQLRCADPSLRHSYWNTSLLDSFMGDLWAAVNGSEGLRAASGGVMPPGGVPGGVPIPSLSTAPTWLYDPTEWRYEDNPLRPDYSYSRGNAPAGNLSALGAYFGRLYAWYTLGGFTDEYGVYHGGGHHYDVDAIEIFNEVDYEHGHTPQSYTAEFDAIVGGIRAAGVDVPGAWPISYNGMNLPNIDNATKVVEWATYFLNASNHDPAVWDAHASASIGYHAYPTQGGFSRDPTTLSGFFDYIDDIFIPKIVAVDAVIAALSPHTRTVLDECGVDADGALNPGGVLASPRFWVASGSYFLYLLAAVNALPRHSVVQVGHSQLMDAPGQEPSVTLLDWDTGRGTAAYWGTWLGVRAWALGDALLPGGSSNETAVHALGWRHTPAPGRPDLPGASGAPNAPRLLLINRHNVWANATVTSLPPGGYTKCTAWVLDERAGLDQPPVVDCSAGMPASRVQLELWPFASAVLEFSA